MNGNTILVYKSTKLRKVLDKKPPNLAKKKVRNEVTYSNCVMQN